MKNEELKTALNNLFLAIVKREEEGPVRCQCCAPGKPRVRYSDLIAARSIAADMSMQTGKNYQNFTSGRYDHAFGVRTALAAIEYGRKNP